MAKFILILLLVVVSGFAQAAKYTPGKFHIYSHANGKVPNSDYQYSVYVPEDYSPQKSYPLVFGCMVGVDVIIPTRESVTWFQNACGIIAVPPTQDIAEMCKTTLGIFWSHQ